MNDHRFPPHSRSRRGSRRGALPVGLALGALLAFAPQAQLEAQQIGGLVAEQGSLAPVMDAIVTLFRVNGDDGELEPAGTSTTDEEGAFLFVPSQPGLYRVQAEYDGLSSPLSPPVEVSVEDGVDDLVLLVPSPLLMLAASCDQDTDPGAVVVGTLTDADMDVAIPNARVSARVEGGPISHMTETTDRGRFLLCGIPTGGVVEFRAESLGRMSEWTGVEIARPAIVFHDIVLSLATRASTGQDVVAELVLGRAAGTMADLRGQLLDQNSELPIAFAVVRLRGTSFQAVTDAEGRFSFTDIRPGDYTLEIQHLGYSVQTSRVEVEQGQDVMVRLLLSPRAVELDGIEITARTTEEETVRTSPFRRYVVSGEDLADAEYRGATLPDVLRQNMIGLRVREHTTEMGTFLCLETNRRIQRLEMTLPDEDDEVDPFRRGPGADAATCHMVQVVIDGARVSDSPDFPIGEFIRGIPIADVESMEFLPPSQGATLYGIGGNVANGVLVIYSRGSGPYRTSERNARDR